MSDTSVPDAAPVPAPSSRSGDMARSAGAFSLSSLTNIAKHRDLALAFAVITILVVLILPMPAMMLDMLLAVSIIFSVLVMMTALFINAPLDFSSFPTVLLIATMLRLSLNLASTRLILSEGHQGPSAAGHVIEAFGNFVMRGNFVIGIIVFAILVLVNFIVITKGSGRIAEVAARFTLDAMPGKQMAIDADLSSGLINEDDARARRKKLESESSFFGAMDGASKFVRGDAIAGLLITFINVIGGMVVGVLQNDLSMAEAAQTYTLLTVGDGLVSQIPALIVSTAAGLLVSKAGVEGSAEKALMSQLSSYPKALGMSSFVMVVMSLLPGIPMIPFLALAAGAGGLAYTTDRQQKKHASAAEALRVAEAMPSEAAEEPISSALKMDELRVELGYGLLPLINSGAEDDRLTAQIKALRRQLASDMGFVMPSVRILDNMQLDSNNYVIKVKEVDAGHGIVYPDQFMVMDPTGNQVDLAGTHTTEPTFGLPATWVDASLREDANFKGYTVVDPATVLSTHLTEILKANMAELLSYGEVQKLLSELSSDQEKLLEDIVPSQISVTGIQRVLQALLNERISIRDLPTILEGIAEIASTAPTIQSISEYVRSRLARQICAGNQSPNGYLPLIALSPQWEQNFADSIVGQGDARQLAMAPSMLQEFISLVHDQYEEAAQQGEIPVLLTSPGVRPFVRSIIERFRSQTTVMSQNEIHPQAKLKTLGAI
ncbi:MAG: flagellar biosynthesis protein FlhA [Fimbriimonadaceae bacterium]|nr:flagellar biosynthesis protein FlhA [Alphaproteobacteria bacterium]